MKKRIFILLILSVIIISFNIPVKKISNDQESNALVQNKKTINKKPVSCAGVSEELYKYYKMNDEENPAIVQTMITEETKILNSGWTTTSVKIRTAPSEESEVLDIKIFNSYIEYYEYNEDWYEIICSDELTAYVSSKYISESECTYKTYTVPVNTGFKSYMPYKAITSKSSAQYKLQKNYAYTGNYGIRMVSGRYCVAIGTAFNAEVGTYFDLVLKNGVVIPCIVGDIKSKKDTKPDNITTAGSGCISEFLVDSNKLDKKVKRSGDISSCKEDWNSSVKTIKIYEKNIFN